MARGKKKGGRRGDDSDSDNGRSAPPAAPASVDEGDKKAARKEKLKARKAQRQAAKASEEQASQRTASDAEQEEEDEEDPYAQVAASMSKKKNKKNKKKAAVNFAALMDDSDSEEEAEEEEEEEEEDEYAQVAASMSKKKSKKKDKKKKHQVEESEEEQEEEEEEEEVEEEEKPEPVVEKKKDKKDKKKSKKKMISTDLFFDPVDQPEEDDKDKKKKKKKKSKLPFETNDDDEEEEDDGEKKSKKDKKHKKDKEGKRLSNKERKRLKEEQERQEREEEYHRAANPMDGAQFSVSQQAFTEDSNWENATDIHIDNFSINAHNKLLYDNASLHINAGGKYGLVGPNGQGKTTILKMIALGELKIPPKIDCLYVEQEVVADDTRAVDAVLKADAERWALLEEEKHLLSELETKQDSALDDRLNEVYEQLSTMNASAAEARARRILFGLGFDSAMQEKVTKDFSGGWRMRISLAKALYVEPTLLMLDEPTNHLDLNAVIWLDDYLQKWKKTLLVVSHDADFLNSVCSEVLHLENKKIVNYKGNYDMFREMEKQKRKQMEKAWEKQQKQLRNLKASGKSSKKATEIVKKKREPGARASKKKALTPDDAADASAPMDLLERPKEYIVQFSFPETTVVSPPILEVREASFRYGDGPYLFKNSDFGIDTTSRVCIVGPNGVGKSTLLKMITGEVTVVEGEVRRNPRVRLGIYSQHFVDKLPMGETPVEYLRRLFQDQTYQQVRNLLGKVGLEGHAHEIKNRLLSGGQKARVVIAELILMRPHILILDEPTNNLDIESIDALCDAIRDFEGGVVIVTHDARLIESTECVLWVCGDQDVVVYDGTFEDYKQSILDDLHKQAQAEEERLAENAVKKAEARAQKIKGKTDAEA
ncbi:ATP-binding cassette sub-family F member 1 [Phytophthora citrophthora]|uniref:ATP-binding cassette sub-family F member 1 n=1 Tax=Phytophthora citrophthora TaxID=4793 RepID=A0AAD9GA97_9STRA|nr:ATP-binding cassette sub-family F member 1 [Phytophthora citrophthora]